MTKHIVHELDSSEGYHKIQTGFVKVRTKQQLELGFSRSGNRLSSSPELQFDKISPQREDIRSNDEIHRTSLVAAAIAASTLSM